MKFFILLFLLGFLLKATLGRFCRAELNTEPEVFKFIGQPIYFTCTGWRLRDIVTVNFHINNTVYLNESYPNTSTHTSPNNVSFHLRVLSSSLTLNNTYVYCSVKYITNNCSADSRKSKILLQGEPSEVSNLDVRLDFTCSANGSLLMNWTQPFSFIPEGSSDAGITYNVVVASIMSELELSTLDTSSMIILPNDDPNRSSCISYNISLIPINAVGSGMTAITMESVLSAADAIYIEDVMGHYIDKNYIIFKVQIEPLVCNITIMLIDIYSGKNIQLPSNNLELTNNCSYGRSLVTFHTSQTTIQENSKYNTTFFLTNSGGHTISHILSTYDVQSMQIENKTEIRLNFVFLENSTAAGALLLFRSPESDIVHFITIDKKEYNRNNFNSTASASILSVYDIEENGELISGVNKPAILPQTESFLPCSTSECIEHKPTNIKSCSKLQFIEKTVMLNCTCTESNRYQVLLLHHTDLDGIVYANSSICSNMVTISVEDFGVYHVTVFYVDNKNGMTGFRAYYVGNVSITSATITLHSQFNIAINATQTSINIGAVVGGIVGVIVIGVIILIVVVGIIICVQVNKSKNNKTMSNKTDLERKPQDKNEENIYVKDGENILYLKDGQNILYLEREEKQFQLPLGGMYKSENEEEDQGKHQPVPKAEAKGVEEDSISDVNTSQEVSYRGHKKNYSNASSDTGYCSNRNSSNFDSSTIKCSKDEYKKKEHLITEESYESERSNKSVGEGTSL